MHACSAALHGCAIARSQATSDRRRSGDPPPQSSLERRARGRERAPDREFDPADDVRDVPVEGERLGDHDASRPRRL
eukprot:6957552-Alexandrium_andersonii.AAC.1